MRSAAGGIGGGAQVQPPPFALRSTQWTRFGFQRDDPTSDLRACGRLAMAQLVYFLELHPRHALVMMREMEGRDILVDGYPWAAAGVNVTAMLLNLFDLTAPQGVLGRWAVARRSYRLCRPSLSVLPAATLSFFLSFFLAV